MPRMGASGTRFKAGFVAVIGRPNVGKSTLINTLLGQKIAAVSPKAQTTRKQQLGILTLEDAQIVFTDTPGLHAPKNQLGERMNEEAKQALEESDAIVALMDVSTTPQEEDELIGEALKGLKEAPPILLGLNKIDLTTPEKIETQQEAYQILFPNAKTILFSALTGENLGELIETIIELLPEGEPFYPSDQVTDLYEREIAADLIREAALHHLRDEVPHGVAVRMDVYKEREEKGAYIEATLFVERESQKGIVIGAGGEMLKEIGTTARQEIEKMSGRKVFLRLRVKVRKNWRNDENLLQLFGFKGKK
jgi:GTP-binding protein Era